jgi:SAM-dependent methyltransferase
MSTPESPEHRVAELERECAELRRALEVVYGSRSWQLTAPLRRVAELGRGRRRAPAAAPGSQRAGAFEEEPGYPPAALRERVAGTTDLGWFKQSGAMAIEDIEEALRIDGRALGDFRHVYDFGCGCGRVTLPLAQRLGADRLTASDSDGDAIAWLHGRLPEARVSRNPALPPLPYRDGEFDLIIGWSIFTHLPESYQDAWLEELERVLAPGGVMLQTVHGARSFDFMGAAPDDRVRNALPAEGFIYYEGNYGADSPFEPHYQTSFHHPDYIHRHWSRWFEVLDVGAARARPSHDMVLLRSRRS